MAERRIVDGSPGKGIISFISNYSWLDGLSFTGMRERYAEVFDRIYIDNGNGDKYRTGKVTPDGKPDPSVFSTPYNREGIQVGTAIATLVRRSPHNEGGAEILYREFWGKDKLEQIAAAHDGNKEGSQYQAIIPPPEIGLPFSPATAEVDYLTWSRLPELFPTFFPGVKTSRDDVVVDIDRVRLEARMATYFSPAVSDEQMRHIAPGAMDSAGRFDATAVRSYLIKRGIKLENFIRYSYRPLDVRWLYWEPETKLLDEKRAEYLQHVFPGNLAMASQQVSRREWSCPQVTEGTGCLDLMDRGASFIPLKLKADEQTGLFLEKADNPDGTNWNLSPTARAYLTSLDAAPDTLFFHALAILHSPAYRTENSGALRQDWPRIPLPATRNTLDASADLGREVAALLDTETPVEGVTVGRIRPDLNTIAVLTRRTGGGLQDGDLAVTAGWGNQTKTGVMPGRGKVEEQTDGTLDVYLNADVYWRGIPPAVWRYTIGGYQVMKKWLSYRELGVLGRPLTVEEVTEVRGMARRIAALVGMSKRLDGNYVGAKG